MVLKPEMEVVHVSGHLGLVDGWADFGHGLFSGVGCCFVGYISLIPRIQCAV
jgi:hypothetical protein